MVVVVALVNGGGCGGGDCGGNGRGGGGWVAPYKASLQPIPSHINHVASASRPSLLRLLFLSLSFLLAVPSLLSSPPRFSSLLFFFSSGCLSSSPSIPSFAFPPSSFSPF